MTARLVSAPTLPRLAVGPMSKNAVDGAIRLAYRHRLRIMLIASRRQVDIAELGGGYVEGWTPETFAEYVRRWDPDRLLLLCRDHGGPWQNSRECTLNYDEAEAMASSLRSLLADIDAGFDLLHLDTSADLAGPATRERATDRLVRLYAECHEAACRRNRKVRFEIGLEDQGVDTNNPHEFREHIADVCERLRRARLPPPTFIVAQTGTKVIETENCGAVVTAPAAVGYAVSELARVCHEFGASLKAHNMDYLDPPTIRHLLRCGVAAINVAPAIGVEETKAFLKVLDDVQLSAVRDRFLYLAYESRAWRKWLKPNSVASDRERAIMAGHYVFNTDEFREIALELDRACRRIGIRWRARLRAAVYRVQERYLCDACA
jgi:tagatose-1,6-bisphosphate aldolase non-catalytic subunit AgaZ/GatZ